MLLLAALDALARDFSLFVRESDKPVWLLGVFENVETVRFLLSLGTTKVRDALLGKLMLARHLFFLSLLINYTDQIMNSSQDWDLSRSDSQQGILPNKW
jgi:hypothetical protein